MKLVLAVLALGLLLVGCGQGPAVVTKPDANSSEPVAQAKTVEPAKPKRAVWPWLAKPKQEKENQLPLNPLVGEARTKEKENQLPLNPLIGEVRTKEKAEAGESDAQFWLGVMYESGEGVPQDFKEAVKWHRKAAEQGHAQAQASLGYMYATGKGVPQDYLTGYAWLNIAATNVGEDAKKHKGIIAKKMTADQIAKAQALSKEMLKKNPKLLN